MPLASFGKTTEISVCTGAISRSRLRELVMSDVVLAIKKDDGSYEAVNKAVRISNPEILTVDNHEIFKAASKKGIQGVTLADDGSGVTDARYSNTKHTLFNLDIATVVGSGPSKNYVEYIYKGKKYYFHDCAALRSGIRTLNRGYEQYLYGNNGKTKVSVTLCLLLSYKTETAYLIDPGARTKGFSYYMLNVKEKKARETLEALFLYLGEILGQNDCYVTNWILGNEVNAAKAWNYHGNSSFNNYMNSYVTAYQILYNGVKAQKSGNTVAISLDNDWAAAANTFAGKKVLDNFAKKIHAADSSIQWSIAYHPYSYPLTRSDFWNDNVNTTNSTSTKYISMKNIQVLTNYVATLEKNYGMAKNSIRVLLTEQGYSYDSNNPKRQAEALARAYYTAEFNNRIDAFIIRAIVDAREEVANGLYLGTMNAQTEKRISFYVYEFMDSDLTKLAATPAKDVVPSNNYGKFNSAKEILCKTNWKNIISGFDASKLAQIK